MRTKLYHIGGKVPYTEKPVGIFKTPCRMKITHKASGQVTVKTVYMMDANELGLALDLLNNNVTGELWTWEAA